MVAAAAGGITFGRMAQTAYDDYEAATTRSGATQLHDEVKQDALIANVSWGIAAVSAGAATWLFVSALREDARAAREAGEALQRAAAPAIVPVDGGAIVTVQGRF